MVFTRIDGNGISGYGEASLPPYLGETHDSVLKFLSKAQKLLERFSNPEDLGALTEAVDAIDTGNTAAKASVDIALNDLYGKMLNRPCHEIYRADPAKPLYTAYTLPIDDEEGIRKRVAEAQEYKLLKVKLGSASDKKTIEKIRQLTDKDFFVDVNEGWADKHFALDTILWLADHKCLFAEQPLPKDRPDDIAWLTERSPIPILADEAVQRISDLEKIQGIYSGINVKLMKCTGMHEANQMMIRAKKYGMKILLGCMSESSCAVSAAAQLAPFADWIDLDGPLLIKEDFFDGVKFSEGKIILNDWPGIGAVPHPSLPSPVGEGKR